MIKLEQIDKTNPFKIPENYFEEVNSLIIDKLPDRVNNLSDNDISYDKADPIRKVKFWDKIKPWLYAAAIAVGVYFTVLLIKNPNNENLMAEKKDHWSNIEVTEDEFYQFLEQQVFKDKYYDYIDSFELN